MAAMLGKVHLGGFSGIDALSGGAEDADHGGCFGVGKTLITALESVIILLKRL
jgi:hypothetical protein